jgi:hypothetical protein
MTALPGMPSTPADVWAGGGVWHVSAIARLLVPERRPGRGTPALPVPRAELAAEPRRQRAAKTPVG